MGTCGGIPETVEHGSGQLVRFPRKLSYYLNEEKTPEWNIDNPKIHNHTLNNLSTDPNVPPLLQPLAGNAPRQKLAPWSPHFNLLDTYIPSDMYCTAGPTLGFGKAGREWGSFGGTRLADRGT